MEPERYAEAVDQIVRAAYAGDTPPSITQTSPNDFSWRRAGNLNHLVVQGPERVVTLRFVAPNGSTRPEQVFAYSEDSVPSVAKAIVEWHNFQRYNFPPT